jgi:hypothetical protein
MLINFLSATSPIHPSKNRRKIYRQILLAVRGFLGVGFLAIRPVAALEPGRVIEVGVQGTVKTLSAASLMAKDRDIIEVDGGDYLGNVAVWTQNDLTLRAKNERTRLIAQGASAESKGI